MGKRVSASTVRFAFIVVALVGPVMIFLMAHGRSELVYPLIAASAAIAVALRGYWELHRFWWFWVTALVMVCTHVLLILLVPWKAGWVPAPVTGLVAIADMAILMGIFSFLQKRMVGERKQEADAD